MKIPLEMSILAYPIAKQIHEGSLSGSDGQKEVSRTTGMNEGSTLAYVTIFLAMLNGSVYKRAFNNQTNEFLHKSIRKDFGEDAFKKAISSARKHIAYHDPLNKGHLAGLENIHDELKGTSI